MYDLHGWKNVVYLNIRKKWGYAVNICVDDTTVSPLRIVQALSSYFSAIECASRRKCKKRMFIRENFILRAITFYSI